MSLNITTKLDPIVIGNTRFTINYKGFDLSEKARKKLSQAVARQLKIALARHPNLSPLAIKNITRGYIRDQFNKRHSLDRHGWDEIQSIVKKGKVLIPIPDGKAVDIVEPSIRFPKKATLTFRNIETPHYQDAIAYPVKDSERHLDHETDADYNRRITRELAGAAYDPANLKTRETIAGISLSSQERKNYEMKVRLEEDLHAFFGCNEFISS
jgi:hypothetical protein